jgi:hypothetical protein
MDNKEISDQIIIDPFTATDQLPVSPETTIVLEDQKAIDDLIKRTSIFVGGEKQTDPPSHYKMASSLVKAALDWTKSGFPIPDPETFNARLETCKGCEFWDESGFAKTGRCKKCGCSTQAKLRMATEKCPIDKW